MRKITSYGIFVVITGFFLVFYSVIQGGSFEMADPYPANRGILILGFVLMAGGGLISLSPFSKRA